MLKKILLGILVFIVLLVAGLLILINTRYTRTFEAPYPAITASTDSALIARGRHLAYGPAHCSYCHAPTSEINRTEAGEEVPLSGGFDFFYPLEPSMHPTLPPMRKPESGNFGMKKLPDHFAMVCATMDAHSLTSCPFMILATRI